MTPLAWLRDRRGLAWPRVVLLGLGVAVLLGLFVAASTSGAAFGLYNPSWDGTSEFRDAVDADPATDVTVLQDTDRYAAGPANETVAFVVAPETAYTDEEAAHVRQFVEAGGTLVVLENFGPHSDALLAAVGAEARLDGRLVQETRHYDRGPAMPVATTVTTHSRTAGVDRLSLNYATAVEPHTATVLVATSDYAYLSESDADELDDNATLASLPVATTEPVGDGEVVVVGDPSLVINVMYDEPDNAAFLRAQYADADRVLFDRSQADAVPPLVGAVLAIRDSPALQLLLGLGVVGAIAALARRHPLSWIARVRERVARSPRRRGGDAAQVGLTDAERAAYLRRRHPDWDEERIQRVIAALNRARSKRDEQ